MKATTVPCFPLASYRVMFHQNEKRTLKHLPLSLIRDSFPFGFRGKREVCWCGRMKTENQDKLPLSRERESGKTGSKMMWAAANECTAVKPSHCYCVQAGWIRWNTRSGTHNRWGWGKQYRPFLQKTNQNVKRHFLETVVPVNHVQLSVSFSETPHFLADVLEKRPQDPLCTLSPRVQTQRSRLRALPLQRSSEVLTSL